MTRHSRVLQLVDLIVKCLQADTKSFEAAGLFPLSFSRMVWMYFISISRRVGLPSGTVKCGPGTADGAGPRVDRACWGRVRVGRCSGRWAVAREDRRSLDQLASSRILPGPSGPTRASTASGATPTHSPCRKGSHEHMLAMVMSPYVRAGAEINLECVHPEK